MRTSLDFCVMHFSVRVLGSVAMGTWDGATEVLTLEMKATVLPEHGLVLYHIHGGGVFFDDFCKVICIIYLNAGSSTWR